MAYAGRHIPKINRHKVSRLDAGYRLKDVAWLLGLKDSSLVSRWESGKSIPSVENLLKLSIIYRKLPNALYWDWFLELRTGIVRREHRLRKKLDEEKTRRQ